MVEKNSNDPGEVLGDEEKSRFGKTSASYPVPKPIGVPVLGGQALPKIAIHTDMDIVDTRVFAKRLLADEVPHGPLSAQLSEDLLVAIVMITAYSHPEHGMSDVLYYLVDPMWVHPRQILTDLMSAKTTAFAQPAAAAWFAEFDIKLGVLWYSDPKPVTGVFEAASRHWSNALKMPIPKPQPKPQPMLKSVDIEASAQSDGRLQVFCAQALEKAVVAMADMPQERRVAGARILEQARADGGKRGLPNAQQAGMNLAAKLLEFENLVEPIERMQVDLALSAAMSPQDFRIAPLLLLGDPGIGKTYLASQLAQALGVPSQKISAGGAQGAFQLSGSHGTWSGALPGMVVSMLAQSSSAAPVLVIDEVDKIQDDRFPFTPVLLDLLDTDTAKRFRDEYFEMEFDASHLIVVLTANDISKVPLPLLSRVEVFMIPSPEPEQRLRIIEQTVAGLCQKTNRDIRLMEGAAERLAERTDIDLRQLHRLVSGAFAKAVQTGADVAYVGATGGKVGRVNLSTWVPSKSLMH